jgi:diguanylate cyclase (GGDEF)-like protein/PAS domain S-box-containing protein
MHALIRKTGFRLFVLLAITGLSFYLAATCLAHNIHGIFQEAFIIPIILSCYWFDKKGIVYSVLVSILFLMMHNWFGEPNPAEEIIRLAMFVATAVIFQRLMGRIKERNESIMALNHRIQGDIELMQKAEQLIRMGVWDLDMREGRVRWSDGLYRLFGFEPGTKTPTREDRLKFTAPEDQTIVSDYLAQLEEGHAAEPLESRVVRSDGSVRWVRSVGSFECDDSGKPVRIIGTIVDFTEQKLALEELRNEKEKFVTTITSIGDGVIAADVEGRVTIMNRVAEDLTGWNRKEAMGLPLTEVFHIINEKTREICSNPVRKVLQTGRVAELANHTALISRNGEEYPIADSAAPIKGPEGDIRGVVLVFRDVSKEKAQQEQIRYISYHDDLTGLFNRRYFEERAHEIDCPDNLPISIIMGDVNGLKITNDAFGHLEGDRLLKKVGEIIGQTCAAFDRESISARWGGDEFVILLPKTEVRQAETLVAQISRAGSLTKINHMTVSVSFGCGGKRNETESLPDALKEAEKHMYERKVMESESVRGTLITTMMNALYEKSSDEALHSRRVSVLSRKTGKAMQLPEATVSELSIIGLLHDIGKIAVSESILNKEERLTGEEWETIKKHPEIGYRIVKSSGEIGYLAEHVLSHHERYDGKGYPAGLKENEITLPARIVAVADSFDAMTSKRPYNRPLSVGEALEEIRRNSGTQFDPQVVHAFTQMKDFNTETGGIELEKDEPE